MHTHPVRAAAASDILRPSCVILTHGPRTHFGRAGWLTTRRRQSAQQQAGNKKACTHGFTSDVQRTEQRHRTRTPPSPIIISAPGTDRARLAPHSASAAAQMVDVCVHHPAVIAVNDSLEINDGSGRRYFAAGMVESGGAPLSAYNASHFAQLLADSAALGATALRWNAFLKGLE